MNSTYSYPPVHLCSRTRLVYERALESGPVGEMLAPGQVFPVFIKPG